MSTHQLVLALALFCAPAAQPAPGQVAPAQVTIRTRGLAFPDLVIPSVARSLMTTGISANGEIVMVSLSSPGSLMTSGPSSEPAGVWVHDVAKGETREIRLVRDGAAWRLLGRAALSADGRFVAASCARDLGPMPKWTPGMTAPDPTPSTTVAVVELSGNASHFVDLAQHGCSAPLCLKDAVSLSGDGAWLAIGTTPDFGRGIDHGWTMLWNSADDSLHPMALDDAYYGLADPVLSADGRWLIACSFSKDDAHPAGLFRLDRTTGESDLVSLAPDNHRLVSGDHSLSADGQLLAFVANDRAAKDATRADVYVRDLVAGTTVCVSRAPDGSEPNGDSLSCSLSGDGSCVAFSSAASNLVAPADDAQPDFFVRELSSGRTIRVGVEDIAPGDRTVFLPALSADGRRAVFCIGVGAQETRVVLADIDWGTSEAPAPR